MNPQKIAHVMSLSSEERYKHFIKVVADWENVWGLYNDGWALSGTDCGETVFPVWPAKEYAELCAKNEWSEYEACSFSLEDFINEILPTLISDSVLVGVFSTPDKGCITISGAELIDDLVVELDKY